jgi:predicted dehydrogenase
MSLQRVRLGILGAGNIADLNVAGYLEHPECEVVAVCDPAGTKAAAAAERWGVARSTTEFSELLTMDLDALEILTPTHLHAEHAMAALAAGLHVSVQKPVANSVGDARRMAEAAAAAGRVLRVTECFCHYPPLERARDLIRAGRIGRPLSVHIRTVVGDTDSAFQAGLNADGYGWRLDDHSPGGHLFDDMVHKYAMATWLVDSQVVRVQAAMRRMDYFFEPLAATFEYDQPDLLGTMSVAYAKKMAVPSAYYGADEFFEVQGDEGLLWVTRATGALLDLPPLLLHRNGQSQAITDVDDDWGSGFRRASQHFVDCLISGSPPEMSAGEAIRVLQLCFAVYQSANEGRPVDPRTIDDLVIPRGWPGGPD